MTAQDREEREIVVLFVQGKGKSRKLVAPKSVGDYLGRIGLISKATEQEDRVFTAITGKPAVTVVAAGGGRRRGSSSQRPARTAFAETGLIVASRWAFSRRTLIDEPL